MPRRVDLRLAFRRKLNSTNGVDLFHDLSGQRSILGSGDGQRNVLEITVVTRCFGRIFAVIASALALYVQKVVRCVIRTV